MWSKTYPTFFVIFVLLILFSQLFVPDFTLNDISENYLWRKSLIKIFNNFKYKVGDKVFANAVIGKDGWLYFTGDMSIQDYQKTSVISIGNVKRITQILNQFKKITDQYGGTVLLVIPPDKSTVYPQYMPDEIPVIGQISSLDRLVDYMNKNGNVEVLDLRSTLESASKSREIYYRTDSHWNCYGAFYGYEAILSELAVSYPHIAHYSLGDFELISSRHSLLDIAALMGLSLNEEDEMSVIPKFKNRISVVPMAGMGSMGESLRSVTNMDAESSPDVMIFHDSFYTACLDQFMEPTFRSTVSLHYGDAQLTNYLDMVAAQKPDIVIVEFVERQMEYFFRHLTE